MIVTLRPMQAVAVLLIGTDADSLAVAKNAAHRVFPDATVDIFQTVEKGVNNSKPSETELLVLVNRDRAEAEKAATTTDSTGLRRWAIASLDTGTMEGVENVSLKEWVEPVLVRAFEAAVAKHQLARQNARLVGDLRTVAYRVSHDLRTPLGGITSTCEVMKDFLAGYSPTDASLTAPILSSTDEISKLIERISFVLKASINSKVKENVTMSEPVSATLQRLERRIIKKNAAVAQPDSWPEVSGVERLLETIWWNLLTNALQHGGKTPRIELGWNEDAGGFRFWIHDNGSGVSPADQVRLFQPFHTLHETNSTRGWGLSITQRLVELQGGHCGYESPAEGGALFFFTLPAK